ncbi:DUF3556 domain-containing protein [Skermania sp. ID1734]|uniref:DUF3556 domain-containing protein n=1 Tax=Skermania sp. ID1734 TaxID=2597516 RepID=UPI00117BE261|nr:DUF3556 domain-containing protein [Skermania sp. ID1734]TSD93669.1 DUF3556 domain-containing protein [Skermania sp. ID1734]
MGFKDPVFPAVDPDEFVRMPLMQRIRILSTDWAENGFGSPYMLHTIYIFKIVVLYSIVGITIANATSGLPAFWHVAEWWNQPIVYQKAVIWTVLLECLNLAGSWGPLAGKVKPMTGGALYYARVGTIRMRPWKWIPGTNGDRRTPLDVALYLLLLVSLVVALVFPGVDSDALKGMLPDNVGLVNPVLLIAPLVLLVLNGLRDKVIFLAARGEQYFPALFFFAVLPFMNMIIALKILIVVVWIGAGCSKFGKHFSNVVSPMVSNSPSMPFKAIKRLFYRDFPRDLRPSWVSHMMAHVGGTIPEIIVPLILFFSPNIYVTTAAALFMVMFHLFIISTFPLAVPLEWNILFGYAAVFLFIGFPNSSGFAPWDMSPAWLAAIIGAALLFFPVLGNFRPDKVSFLPSMRQYAGNWASALWSFAPGTEQKLNRVTKPAKNQIDQFIEGLGMPKNLAELHLQRTIGWRSLHSQARGLFSLLLTRTPDIDSRDVREAEFLCNSVLGFNFGDGHMHNEEFIKAVQDEAQFAPGECIIAWVESEALGSGIQRYKVIDAALGVIETGTWRVADAVNEQPWLPNGPIPLNTTWSRTATAAPAQTNGQQPAVHRVEARRGKGALT